MIEVNPLLLTGAVIGTDHGASDRRLCAGKGQKVPDGI